MAEFMLKLAGRCVGVSALYDDTAEYCKNYIIDSADAADFSVVMSQGDIDYEKIKAARQDELEGLPVRKLSDAFLELTAVQRKIAEELFRYDTLLFHGSVVAVDGEAYLFTAKSGTGKSTHTRLWRELLGDRAVMVNDDKPFLRLTEQGVLACGSPWNGKHGLGNNLCVPLKAVCILERGEENRIRPVSAKQALTMLVQQSNRPMDRKWLPKYLELLDRLACSVEFYRLACNMDPRAALVSYQAMSGNGKDEEA